MSLKYFGLPFDDLKFYQLKAVSENGRTRAIRVRYLPSGAIDIFLLDLESDSGAGYFYLTGLHGQLTKAAYFDEKPEPVSGAQVRFEREVEFWRLWQDAHANQ